jgi:hypothetical protein
VHSGCEDGRVLIWSEGLDCVDFHENALHHSAKSLVQSMA